MKGTAAREDPEAVRAAREIAGELMAKGASAVVLFGSHVRGDAYPESDLDIYAIGKGPFYRLERRGKYLASISWRTVEEMRGDMRKPDWFGGIIPGWRNSMILADPEDIASTLRKEALDLDWESMADECDSWVAEELTGLAEEVHRLVGNLELGRRTVAAAQRSVLALHLAGIMAVHHRISYDSENQIWDLVSEKIGEPWADTQSRALGLGGEDFEETCAASLELFSLAVFEVQHLLNKQQYQVVAYACSLTRRPLDR